MNTKLTIIFSLIFIFVAIVGLPAKDVDTLFTGYDWEGFSYSMKADLIVGFLNGVFALANVHGNLTHDYKYLKVVPYNTAIDSLIHVVDNYYLQHPRIKSVCWYNVAFSIIFKIANQNNPVGLVFEEDLK